MRREMHMAFLSAEADTQVSLGNVFLSRGRQQTDIVRTKGLHELHGLVPESKFVTAHRLNYRKLSSAA